MKKMRQRTRWKSLSFLTLSLFQLILGSPIDEPPRSRSVQKSLFSPRMDYNQWKPLGRGDPLKNDPTFDYVPPVLDHVHYWMDPDPQTHTNSDNTNGKSEILLLGVSSKKPAITNPSSYITNKKVASDRRDTIYEPFPKYHYQDKTIYNNNLQRIARPNYFPSVTSQIIPSIMSLANQVLDRTVYSKVPDTVLMPPPLVTKIPSLLTTPMTQKPPFSQTTAVTVQESNLIYQSSSLGNQNEFEAVPSINWELTTEPIKSNFAYQELSPPKSFMRIQFSPQNNYTNKILEASDSNQNINYVTPPPLDDTKLTFKGQVSDDNDISDSYVKIEKPQAQMDHMGVEIDNIHPLPIIFTNPEPFRPSDVSMETIRDMETMKPPPVTQSPVYTRPTNPITNVLKEEHTNYIGSGSSISNTFVTTPKIEASTLTETTPPEITTIPPPTSVYVTTTTTELEPPTTTMQTLTTDPLFKHYKQPLEPIKGPLYLIIQGHSKVKTYKPAKQIDGIMVQETNEIFDKNIDYNIKHLHGFGNKEDFLERAATIAKQRQARTGNLQTLKHVVQTGLGAIDFGNVDSEARRRSDTDLEETELEAGYEVVDSEDVTSEKYHKGIVEEARKL